MQSISKRIRTILIDVLGVLLIIMAGLTGWIPGPGGIPLLIAGLGLLSINHEWAKRWLETVRQHGLKLSDKLFNNSPRVMLVIDIVGLLFVAAAVLVVTQFTRNIAISAGFFLFMFAFFLLLGNRKRFQKIRGKH